MVSIQHWDEAVKSLNGGNHETLPLYLNKINLAVLPSKCSRHNAPSRAHALTKLVKSSSNNQVIVVACERKDVFASGCAIPRAFPTFCMKTTSTNKDEYSSAPNVSTYLLVVSIYQGAPIFETFPVRYFHVKIIAS